MDEKRLEELKPLVDAMRELPRDERVKAIAEFKALGALGKNLDELSERCERQPGAVAWALMQTMVNGRRGFQLFMMNHETGEYTGLHYNAFTLGELAAQLAEDLDEKRTIGGTASRVARKLETKRCGQVIDGEQCPRIASYRYTWPGRSEAFICGEHVGKLRSVAEAIGLPLQLIELEGR